MHAETTWYLNLLTTQFVPGLPELIRFRKAFVPIDGFGWAEPLPVLLPFLH
jgi:hypothetical protein